MRILVTVLLTGALAVVGCGDDEGTTGGNGTGGNGTGGNGTGGSAGAGAMGGSGGTGGMPGASPVITNIAWTSTDAGCEQFGGATDYTVTVTATDADNDETELTYTGSVSACSPSIDGAVTTISCPNNAPYPGSVVVEDPDGNTSATASFTVGVCETSSCDGSPGAPCSL